MSQVLEKVLEEDWKDHQGNRRLSIAHTFQVKQEKDLRYPCCPLGKPPRWLLGTEPWLGSEWRQRVGHDECG